MKIKVIIQKDKKGNPKSSKVRGLVIPHCKPQESK